MTTRKRTPRTTKPKKQTNFVDNLKSTFPDSDPFIMSGIENYFDELTKKYQIDSPLRLIHFFGQAGHESFGFKRIEENLNYSEKRLREVFPRHFRIVNPKQFANNPEKIANYVYGGRLGNIDHNDGWTFRGFGLFQLTGRYNYTKFAKHLGISVGEVLDYIRTERGLFESACWFWFDKNLNRHADNDDFETITRIISGGSTGIESRKKYTDLIRNLL